MQTVQPTAASDSLQAWIDRALDVLERMPCGYRRQSTAAAEPTALATLALAGAGRTRAAQIGARWLGSQQQPDGSLSPLGDLKWPGWATPLAMLATLAATRESLSGADEESPRNDGVAPNFFDVERAKTWLIEAVSIPQSWSTEFGHDLAIVGWPWVAGTHSWVEPTAWSVLALKALGLGQHSRTREGVQMLVDRLLTTGGCNYGNTVVLGQRLRPHVEPTGLAMLALAGEANKSPKIERSLQYLTSTLNAETTPISLSYGLLGLAAFDRTPVAASNWLADKFREVLDRDRAPIKLALLTLAAQGRSGALFQTVGWGDSPT